MIGKTHTVPTNCSKHLSFRMASPTIRTGVRGSVPPAALRDCRRCRNRRRRQFSTCAFKVRRQSPGVFLTVSQGRRHPCATILAPGVDDVHVDRSCNAFGTLNDQSRPFRPADITRSLPKQDQLEFEMRFLNRQGKMFGHWFQSSIPL